MNKFIVVVLTLGMSVTAFAQKSGSSVYADMGLISNKDADGSNLSIGWVTNINGT